MSQSRTRLLIFGPLPPPTAGVEALTGALLARMRSDAGWRVRCVDTQKRRVPVASRGRLSVSNLAHALWDLGRLAWALALFRPRVVHAPFSSTTTGIVRDAVVVWMCRAAGASVVAHLHGGDFDRVVREGPRWAVVAARGALRSATRVVVLSRYWEQLVGEALGPVRSVVVENGSEDLGPPARTLEGSAPIRLLHVGAQGRRKGVHELLRAIARLRERGVDAHLTLVGDEEWTGEGAAIDALVDALDLGAVVHRAGHLEGDARRGPFAEADLFALPSHHEGAPVAILEAFSAGLPVIASPVGAVPEMLDDPRGGRLVPAGDVEGLADAIGAFARDARRRREAGRFNRERWEEAYRMDAHVDRVASLLRAVSAPPGASG